MDREEKRELREIEHLLKEEIKLEKRILKDVEHKYLPTVAICVTPKARPPAVHYSSSAGRGVDVFNGVVR